MYMGMRLPYEVYFALQGYTPTAVDCLPETVIKKNLYCYRHPFFELLLAQYWQIRHDPSHLFLSHSIKTTKPIEETDVDTGRLGLASLESL